MGGKVNIFADIASFLNLLTNPEFVNGRDLKCLIRQRADVFLIIDSKELEKRWSDKEDVLRKSCDAYDISCPYALPELAEIFENPAKCYQHDPYGLWMINTTEESIQRFRDYLGVWMVNSSLLKDDTFYLHHKREYEKDDIISGSSTINGWANYIEKLSAQGKELPPMNAIVINDRHLLLNTNEHNAERYGFWGLNNLKYLFDALLPSDLKIPFQLTIYCQHPQLDIAKTDEIVNKFKIAVQGLRRSYSIQIEFIYDVARHKRTFHSNYFLFDVDRAYNAFYATDYTKLNGENYFCIESYHNDPHCSGDTNYITARKKLGIIKKQCDDILATPCTSVPDMDYSKIKRVDLPDPTTIQNRLFTT